LSEAKVKINLNDGTIELEGSESFVEKHWNEIKSLIEKQPQGTLKKANSGKKNIKKRNASGKKEFAPKYDLKLIPLNLKGNNTNPSLTKFFADKSPTSQQQIVTCFAYYLKIYLKIDEMKPGHALFCYNEVNEKKPLEIVQLFRDTASRKGWLQSGVSSGSTTMTIGGENLVKHDLPNKSKSKPSKK